jgi:hypothetical protein
MRRLFMRMRSPSSAPPVRRRVGSTASTAMRLRSGKLAQEARQQLVGHAALAGAAGAGDADHRHLAGALPFLAQRASSFAIEHAVSIADSICATAISSSMPRFRSTGGLPARRLGAPHQVLDHADQAHAHAVARVVDALDAVAPATRRFPPG